MKKNFVKKLALGLALVMTVGSVNMPVAAEAASEPGFKSTAVNVKVGQTKKYSTNHYGKWSVKKFVIGNKNVATISYTKGSKAVKVTGVAEGTTRLRADFKAYKSKREVSARIPVTVTAAEEVVTVAELASVKQTASNVFEATFTADASKTFTAESFTKIESADGIYTLTVKSVEFSTDGLTAKVATYGNFVDNTVFNVTCGEKTVSFTASVGAVKTAVINTVQAEANVKTPIEFTLYDANGIDVTSAVAVDKYVSLYVDGDYYEVNTTTPSKANVTLSDVGGTVTVTLIYDPVSATGEVITVTGTITCVDTKAAVGKTTYFTKGNTYGTVAPKIYLNSFAEATTLYADDSTENFYFAALDKNGDAIEYDSFELESSNEDVITVAEGIASNTKYEKIEVTPQGVGTAKVIIKATKNDVETVYSGTVIVKAERKLSSIVLSKSSLTISDSYVNDNDYVDVMLMDQYGNLMSDSDLDVSFTAAQHNGNSEIGVTYSSSYYGSVDVTGTAGEGGSYIVTVEANDGTNTISKKFAVKVKELNNALNPTYKVELSTNSMDLNPEVRSKSTNVAGNVKVKVAEYYGTVFAGYVGNSNESTNTVDYLTVKKGGKYFKSTDLTNISTSGITTTVVKANSVAGDLSGSMTSGLLTLETTDATGGFYQFRSGDQFAGVDCVAETGTYTVTAVITGSSLSKSVSATANFAVKNTMEMPTVTVDATTGEGSNALDLVKDCVTVDVDVLAGTEDNSIKNVYGKDCKTALSALDSNDKVTIKYVEVEDTFYGTTYRYFVPVSRTFKAE